LAGIFLHKEETKNEKLENEVFFLQGFQLSEARKKIDRKNCQIAIFDSNK